ncbi:hypothetical protein cyc_05754 [Cyclospora cayetanensis]|uniref:Uncharacterized protein n=1 Tax=Cyclospora cayetanensis TaxID=88456 RepID=A0A1D3D4T5_9EIME|nr:hypothetical protein cyc_05754 [Cyclospora cayetanensis]
MFLLLLRHRRAFTDKDVLMMAAPARCSFAGLAGEVSESLTFELLLPPKPHALMQWLLRNQQHRLPKELGSAGAQKRHETPSHSSSVSSQRLSSEELLLPLAAALVVEENASAASAARAARGEENEETLQEALSALQPLSSMNLRLGSNQKRQWRSSYGLMDGSLAKKRKPSLYSAIHEMAARSVACWSVSAWNFLHASTAPPSAEPPVDAQQVRGSDPKLIVPPHPSHQSLAQQARHHFALFERGEKAVDAATADSQAAAATTSSAAGVAAGTSAAAGAAAAAGGGSAAAAGAAGGIQAAASPSTAASALTSSGAAAAGGAGGMPVASTLLPWLQLAVHALQRGRQQQLLLGVQQFGVNGVMPSQPRKPPLPVRLKCSRVGGRGGGVDLPGDLC